MSLFLTLDEAAKRMGWVGSTIRAMAKRGEIPDATRSENRNGLWLIPVAWVDSNPPRPKRGRKPKSHGTTTVVSQG